MSDLTTTVSMPDVTVGVHVPGDRPLVEAEERGADLIQMFVGDPQSWKKPAPRSDAGEVANAELPVYVHAPYLINVASPNNRIRIPSRKNLVTAGEAAVSVGARALIVHGGHVGDDEPIAVGFERWAKALEAFTVDIPVLIENTAGGGNAVARDLANFAPLWDAIGSYNVGACLDTCHAWAAGQDLEAAVATIVDACGSVSLVHLNDSRDEFDSRRDRHTNLGSGEIPVGLMAAVATDAGAPIVLETPGGVDDHRADIDWVHRHCGD